MGGIPIALDELHIWSQELSVYFHCLWLYHYLGNAINLDHLLRGDYIAMNIPLRLMSNFALNHNLELYPIQSKYAITILQCLCSGVNLVPIFVIPKGILCPGEYHLLGNIVIAIYGWRLIFTKVAINIAIYLGCIPCLIWVVAQFKYELRQLRWGQYVSLLIEELPIVRPKNGHIVLI